MYTDHITIAGILERLMRHPLLRDLSYADATFYAIECLNNIGSVGLLTKKGEFIEVVNHKAYLPFDFVSLNSKIDGVRRAYIDKEAGDYTFEPMYAATDQYHINYSQDNRYFKSSDELNTYTISGRIITTGFVEGNLEVTYYGLAITETGEIMIPRHPFVIKAIEEYIKQEYFRILYDLDKIKYNTYAKAEQEYLWAVGKASNATKALSIAEREALSNMLTRLVTTDNDFAHGFRDTYATTKQTSADYSPNISVTGVQLENGDLNLDEIDGGDATTA